MPHIYSNTCAVCLCSTGSMSTRIVSANSHTRPVASGYSRETNIKIKWRNKNKRFECVFEHNQYSFHLDCLLFEFEFNQIYKRAPNSTRTKPNTKYELKKIIDKFCQADKFAFLFTWIRSGRAECRRSTMRQDLFFFLSVVTCQGRSECY